LVEGFDAGLAVSVITLRWQQRLLGLWSQQQSWNLGGRAQGVLARVRAAGMAKSV